MSYSNTAIKVNLKDYESIRLLRPLNNGNRGTLEKAIVQGLAAEYSASIGELDPDTANKMASSLMSDSLRDTFEISTTATTDGKFALLSQFQTGETTIESTFSGTVCGNSYSTNVQQPSVSFADSSLKFQVTNNYGPFYNIVDGELMNDFQVTFDSTGTNVDAIKAINSQFTRSDNTRPMQIVESDANSGSLGNDKTHYYLVDSTTGQPIAYDMPVLNNLVTNGFIATNNDAYNSYNTVNTPDRRFGTLKLVREEQQPVITINGDSSDNNDSGYLPFINLPTNTLSEDVFLSAFDIANNVIDAGYHFNINVVDVGDSSGFGFGTVSNKFNADAGITMDDLSLLNNQTYMENWVEDTHSIEIAKPSFYISAVNSSNTDNVGDFTLSTGYETLTQANNNDGQIKINKRTPNSRVDFVNSLSNVGVNVYYDGEDNTKSSIVLADKETSYVEYSARKVWQQPSSSVYVDESNGSFKTNNNAALNLYCTEVVNSSFNTNNFDFSFTPSEEDEVLAFKVRGTKPLTEINGLLKTSGDVPVNGISVSSVLRNFRGILTDNTYFSNAKINFTSKPVSELSFIPSVVDSDGWILSGTDSKTTSTNAFNQDDTRYWPIYDHVVEALTNDYSINVTMTINTGTDGGANVLQDKVHITYEVLGETTSTENVSVYQGDLTFENQTKESESVTAVPNSQFSVTGPLVGRNIVLERHIVVRKYRYNFKLNIRPYENLSAKTPFIRSETTMYKIKDLSTSTEANPKYYSSTYLKHVHMNNSSSLNSLETISAWTPGTYSTTKTFTIEPNDFKSLKAIIVGTNTNGVEHNLTDSTSIDPYYGIDTIIELLPTLETTVSDGDIVVNMNCEYLDNVSDLQSTVTFEPTDNWNVPLIPDYSVNYTVENFTSTYTGLDTNTDINNDTNILTVDNGFSNITHWNTDYNVVVTYTPDGVTKLSIRDSEDAEKFYINLNNNISLVTTAIVTYSEYDAYRYVKQIGDTTPVTTSGFMSVDQQLTEYELSSGIYINVNSGYLSGVANGAMIDFTLKGDACGVNMVGTVSSLNDLTYSDVDGNGLQFQYVNGGEYSRQLNLPYYRGYLGQQNVNQVYTINRGKLSAVFTITDGSNVASQTFSEIYAGYSDTVYNLNSDSSEIGSIGLLLSFDYSLLDDSKYSSNEGELLSIPIVNSGDTVTIEISNGSGTVQPVPEPTTLKTFSLYQFSGSNFNNTGAPLTIRSYRLKVNSTEYDELTSSDWTIELQDSSVKIYYNSNYIGDPTSFTYSVLLDTVDVNTMKDTGFDFYGWNVIIDDSITTYSSTSYWTIIPPYIKFNHIKYMGSIGLPYTSSTQAVNNVIKYVPVSDSSTYNPFSNTSQINNITYVDQRERYISDFVNYAVSTPYEVYVEGNTYTISYCLGLQEEDYNPVVYTQLFSGPANELLSISASSSSFWTNAPVANNSGVLMNFLQPTLSQLYTSAVLTGESPVPPNILVNIGSFFYPELTEYLNLPVGDGVRTNLYTHEVEKLETNNDYDDTYANFKITVYKYNPIGISDWNDYNITNPPTSNTSKQLVLTYNERYYYQKTVSFPLGDENNVNDYITLIKEEMPLGTISWTYDEDYDGTTDNVIIKYLSKKAKTDIPLQFFTLLPSTNNARGVLVNQESIFSIIGKIGYPNMSINNNGTVTTTSVTFTPS